MRRTLWVALLCACGGSEKKEVEKPDPEPEEAPADKTPAPDDEEPTDIKVEGLLGQLQPSEIQPVIEMRWTDIEECYRDNVGKNRFVGGHIELKFRVFKDGRVKSVFIAEGDLGSWPVEKCVLAITKAMTFPRPTPKGHEAEFGFPIDFPGRGSVNILAESGSDEELQPKLPALAKCKEGSPPARVRVTSYTGPGGLVKSAGFISPDGPLDEKWADCAYDKAITWKLTDPRGKVVKASSWYSP
jgi:hypothetical protein